MNIPKGPEYTCIKFGTGKHNLDKESAEKITASARKHGIPTQEFYELVIEAGIILGQIDFTEN